MEYIFKHCELYFVLCILSLIINNTISSSKSFNCLILDIIQTFISNSSQLALSDFSFSVYTNDSAMYSHKGFDIYMDTGTTNLLSVTGRTELHIKNINLYVKDCKSELYSFLIVERENILFLSQVIDITSAVELGKYFQYDEYLVASISEKLISSNCNNLLNENIKKLRLPEAMSLNISSKMNNLQIRIWKLAKENKFSYLYRLQRVKHGITIYDLLQRKAVIEDFQGMILDTVSTYNSEIDEPINTYKFVNGTLFYDKGWAVFLLQDFQEIFNFGVTAKTANGYITQLPDGVGGVGRYAISGEADLVIGSWYLLPYRVTYLKPTLEIRTKEIAVFFMQPHRSSLFRNVFVKPFSDEVWLTIAASVVVLLVTYQIISRFDKKLPSNDASALITAAALNQNYFSPATFSSRIFFISIILTFYVVWTFYAAYLISILTMDVKPISSFDSLIQEGYTIIAHEFDNNSCQNLYGNRKIKNSHALCNNFINEHDSVRKIFQSQCGYIKSMDHFSIIAKSLNYTDQKICTVSSIKFPYPIPITSFYMPKDSILAWTFNPVFQIMNERGIMNRKNKVFDDVLVKCNREKLPFQEHIAIQDVFVAFCIFFAGVAISIAILITEKLISLQKVLTHNIMLQLN